MLNLFQHLRISKKVRFDREGCAIVSLRVELRDFHGLRSYFYCSSQRKIKDLIMPKQEHGSESSGLPLALGGYSCRGGLINHG